MPVEKIDIDKFLLLAEEFPVLDVRSPAEFAHAHIEGALPVPLFTDEQRKIIGTAYVQQSRKQAVDFGLEYCSQRMKTIPGEVEKLAAGHLKNQEGAGRTYLVHCWRGGMRSDAVAWLLNLYGYKIYLLRGGYKAFRRWVLSQFDKKYPLKIIGGFTGSGKTELLKELGRKGENVIDLESLAHHKGSAFGALGEEAQPSSEMFENRLALALWRLSWRSAAAPPREIWLEDESVHIGTVGIPKAFWQQMRASPLYFLEIPFEKRLGHIVKCYGVYDRAALTDCVLKIQKRLGGLNAKNAVQLIAAGQLEEAFTILLTYYDKMYAASFGNRQNLDELVHKIPCRNTEIANAALLLRR